MRERNKAASQSVRSEPAPHYSTLQDEKHPLSRGLARDREIAVGTFSGPATHGQRALLLRILDALSDETDLDDLLHQVVLTVAEQLAAHSAYLCLYCEDQSVLRLAGWYVREDLSPARGPATVSAQVPRTAPAGSL